MRQRKSVSPGYFDTGQRLEGILSMQRSQAEARQQPGREFTLPEVALLSEKAARERGSPCTSFRLDMDHNNDRSRQTTRSHQTLFHELPPIHCLQTLLQPHARTHAQTQAHSFACVTARTPRSNWRAGAQRIDVSSLNAAIIHRSIPCRPRSPVQESPVGIATANAKR
jgi:hypothetical protein